MKERRPSALTVEQERAERALWPKLGGRDKVIALVQAVNNLGGKVYIHGSGGRFLSGEEDISVDDVDVVITGVGGSQIEQVAKEVLGAGVKARRQKEGGLIKTVEFAKDGKTAAEFVPARINGIPGTEATIQDHLQGCWTADGKVLAYELVADNMGIGLKKIEVEKEVDLNPETVRSDHIWWWFRALVTNRVPEEIKAEAEAMIRIFVETRRDEMVNWRKDGQSLEEWLSDCRGRGREIVTNKRSGLPRVKALAIRAFEGYHAEGILKKLSQSLHYNAEEFWRIGVETGLLPLIFPVLGCIPEGIQRQIEINLERAEGDTEHNQWLAIFGPVWKELYQTAVIAHSIEEWGYENYSWEEALALVTDDRVKTTRESWRRASVENRVSVGEQLDTVNWRIEALWPFVLKNEGPILAALKRQLGKSAVRNEDYRIGLSNNKLSQERKKYIRDEAKKKARLKRRNGYRWCRELAHLIERQHVDLFEALMSYLPLGGVVNKRKLRQQLEELIN